MFLLEIKYDEVVIDFLKFIIPGILVFGITYMILFKFLEEDYKKRLVNLKMETAKTITPLKLQAYERLTIFLDRISPDNLVMRHSAPKQSATELKFLLIRSIDEEFQHNISQQIYVSTQAWKAITIVKEQVLFLIDSNYRSLAENARGTDLGKAILSELQEKKERPTQKAIEFLKKEIQLLF